MTPIYRVRVGGLDISARLNPVLLSIDVDLTDEPGADKARMMLEDSGGRLALPPDKALIEIELGTLEEGIAGVFSGTISPPRSEGARGSGCTLHIDASSADPEGKAKQPRERNYDGKSVGDALRNAGRDVGLQVSVHPDLAAIRLPDLAQDGESFEEFGARLSEELGGTFKIMGRRALLIPRNAGLSATGRALMPIRAENGVNLERWSLTPVRSRQKWRRVRVRSWDAEKARYVYREVETDAGSEAEHVSAQPASNATHAGQRAEGGAAALRNDGGEGSVDITGTVRAMPGAPVDVVGTRPGFDGSYLAGNVRLRMSRGSGFTCGIDLKRPDVPADTRRKQKA